MTGLARRRPDLAAADLPGLCKATVAACTEDEPLQISSGFLQTSLTSSWHMNLGQSASTLWQILRLIWS